MRRSKDWPSPAGTIGFNDSGHLKNTLDVWNIFKDGYHSELQ